MTEGCPRMPAIHNLNDESGQATVIMALVMGLVMLGFLALATDVGYLFYQKRMAQSAADAAAIAAAEEYSAGYSGNAQNAANAAATMNGFDTTLASNPATVTLSTSTTGYYSSAGSHGSAWVTAVVARPIPTFFLAAFSSRFSTMQVSASATGAEGLSSPTCVCMQGTSGQNLNMSNGTSLSAPSCGITADSSASNAIGIVGGSSLSAQTLGTISSNWNNNGNINNGGSISSSTKIVQGISTQCSPSLPAAPTDTTCSADPFSSQSGGGAKYTVGPSSSYGTTMYGTTICYNALTVNGNGDTVTLNPGIYVINGGALHFLSGTNGGGNGVTFYLTGNASLIIDNGANVNLTAPTSGIYSGIVFYQAASDTNVMSIQGGSSTVITGAILAPGAGITLGNGSGSNISASIDAQTLTMTGGASLSCAPSVSLGTLNTSVAKLVR